MVTVELPTFMFIPHRVYKGAAGPNFLCFTVIDRGLYIVYVCRFNPYLSLDVCL